MAAIGKNGLVYDAAVKQVVCTYERLLNSEYTRSPSELQLVSSTTFGMLVFHSIEQILPSIQIECHVLTSICLVLVRYGKCC